MPQNKLKMKVDALTRVMQQLIKDVQRMDAMSRGTLTAFQLYLGEKKWEKVVKQLQDKELEDIKKSKEKKLDLDVE
tara:strand:+ start:150 stop:377 length:228 start_codon:yes stop_codon:yes gene_type:complete